jgi:hypothetical protein
MTNERTPMFLMANLGSEVTRLLSAKKCGDGGSVKEALKRCRGILRTLGESCSERSAREELRLLQSVIERQVADSADVPLVLEQSLKRYFVPFAVRVMSGEA